MKTLNVMLSNLGGRVVPIGYEGENLYTRVRINCIEVFADYPDATVSMVVNPPTGNMYPAIIEKSGVMVIWDISDAVLSSNGSGECQLTFTEGDVVRKSVIFGISINRSLVASGEAPEPVQEWIERAEQTAQEIAENAANLAKQDIVDSYGSIAPAIIETASGEIASFSDGADGMLVKTMTVDIDPVQDLHGYDSPWPAGGGKNKSVINEASLVKGETDSITVAFDTPLLAGDYILTSDYSGTATVVRYVLFSQDSVDLGNVNVATNQTSSIQIASPAYSVRVYIGSSQTQGATANVTNIMLRLATETDATYVPYSNVCPISGFTSADVTRTGKNLWDEVWETGYISNGGSNADAEGYIRSKNYISVLPSTAYYFLIPGSFRVFYYKADKTFISYNGTYSSARELTTPNDCKYVRFYTNQSTYGNDISINYPSTDIQYHPGHVQQITYTFPQSAGTVYGGTLTIHQDGTGTLVDYLKKVTYNGTENWKGTTNAFYLDITGDYLKASDAKGVCDSYEFVGGINGASALTEDCTVGMYTGNSYNRVYIRADQYASVTELKAALVENNVTVCYELAEPVSYELTAQQVVSLLKGQNNVWADTGDVSLEYPADTKLYIDARVAELQALILENISNS